MQATKCPIWIKILSSISFEHFSGDVCCIDSKLDPKVFCMCGFGFFFHLLHLRFLTRENQMWLTWLPGFH